MDKAKIVKDLQTANAVMTTVNTLNNALIQANNAIIASLNGAEPVQEASKEGFRGTMPATLR